MTSTNITADTHITGWITPRLEHVLKRAAAIAGERGLNYLGVEHLAEAMMEDPYSVLRESWRGALTPEQWHDALRNAPSLTSNDEHTPSEGIRIEVARQGPISPLGHS